MAPTRAPPKVIDALRRAEVLHIACHASYGGHDETGFHLAGSSFLSLRRLAASGFERVSTRLVFLSACEAGMSGRTLDADEFVGLPGTLMELGVATVIAPLWAVYDDAALVLADCFYRNFLGRNGTTRMSPAEALSEAKSFLRMATLQHLIESEYIEEADAAGFQPVRLKRMQCTIREQADTPFVRDSERPFFLSRELGRVDSFWPHFLNTTQDWTFNCGSWSRAKGLAEMGGSAPQIGAWTGHESLKEIERYIKDFSKRRALSRAKEEHEVPTSTNKFQIEGKSGA